MEEVDKIFAEAKNDLENNKQRMISESKLKITQLFSQLEGELEVQQAGVKTTDPLPIPCTWKYDFEAMGVKISLIKDPTPNFPISDHIESFEGSPIVFSTPLGAEEYSRDAAPGSKTFCINEGVGKSDIHFRIGLWNKKYTIDVKSKGGHLDISKVETREEEALLVTFSPLTGEKISLFPDGTIKFGEEIRVKTKRIIPSLPHQFAWRKDKLYLFIDEDEESMETYPDLVIRRMKCHRVGLLSTGDFIIKNWNGIFVEHNGKLKTLNTVRREFCCFGENQVLVIDTKGDFISLVFYGIDVQGNGILLRTVDTKIFGERFVTYLGEHRFLLYGRQEFLVVDTNGDVVQKNYNYDLQRCSNPFITPDGKIGFMDYQKIHLFG